MYIERINSLMRERGLNKTELSRRAGLSREYLSRILNQNRNPTIAILEGLAEALDVEAWELLTDPAEAIRSMVASRQALEEELEKLREYEQLAIDSRNRVELIRKAERIINHVATENQTKPAPRP